MGPPISSILCMGQAPDLKYKFNIETPVIIMIMIMIIVIVIVICSPIQSPSSSSSLGTMGSHEGLLYPANRWLCINVQRRKSSELRSYDAMERNYSQYQNARAGRVSYPILSNPILSNPILSYPILYPILSYSPPNSILSSILCSRMNRYHLYWLEECPILMRDE